MDNQPIYSIGDLVHVDYFDVLPVIIEAINRRKKNNEISFYYTVSNSTGRLDVNENNIKLFSCRELTDRDKSKRVYPVTPEKCVKNIIIFPDESKFDLDELGFTMKELYVMLRGLTSLYELDEYDALREKVRRLIYSLQSLEQTKSNKWIDANTFNRELDYMNNKRNNV